jgi:outer membrane protein assembly factor BamB
VLRRRAAADGQGELVEVELHDTEPVGPESHDDRVRVEASGGGRGGARGLDPVGSDDAVDHRPSGSAPAGAPARGRRALPWVAGAAVVGFVVGANLVEAGRDAARVEALAEVPGVLASLAEPVEEQWRAEGSWILTEVGGVLVVEGGAGSGVRGIDSVTGAERWALPRSSSEHDVSDPPYCTGGGGPVGHPGEERTVLICVQGSRAFLGQPEEVDTTVSVVDPRTGDVSMTLAVEGSVLSTELVEGDPVVVTVDGHGYVDAFRVDAGSGERLWEYRSDYGLAGAFGNRITMNAVEDGVLHVVGRGTVAVDLATGEPAVPRPIEPGFGDGWTNTAGLSGQATVEWTFGPMGEFQSGQVVEEDGTVRFSLPGPPWWPPVHDGSVPDVVVVQGVGPPDLHGLDAHTGEVRWVAEGTALGYPVLQVDGVLVSASGQKATAVDVRDGTVLWTAPVDPSGGSTGLTDGTVVLLQRVEEGETFIAAHGLRDGTEHWRAELPADTFGVMPTMAGSLVAFTGEHLIGLG